MKTILLLEATLTNFKSFRSERVVFPQEPGLRFLGGVNKESATLGANGAGKSTLWDAILWCLYGLTSKTSKIGTITTWGEEETVVEILLLVAGVEYRIRRAGPPVKVYLDTVLVEQSSIDRLLSMEKLPFQHSVLFSQGQKLFPDLSLPERGELLEEVLNLGFWARCSEQATEAYSELAKKKAGEEVLLAGIGGQLKSLPTESVLTEKLDAWEASRWYQVDQLIGKRIAWDNEHVQALLDIKDQMSTWENTRATRWAEIQESINRWEDEKVLRVASLKAQIVDWETRANADLERLATALDTEERLLADLQTKALGIDYSGQLAEAKEREAASELALNAARSNCRLAQEALRALNRQLEILTASGTCSQCGQKIEVQDLVTHQTELELKIVSAQEALTALDEALRSTVAVHDTAKGQADKLRELYAAESARCTGVRNQIGSVQKQVDKLSNEASELVRKLDEHDTPYAAQLQESEAARNPYLRQAETFKQEANPYLANLRLEESRKNTFPNLIEQEKAKPNPYEEQLTEMRTQRAALELQQSAKAADIATLERRLTAIDYWKQGFKRIRLYLIQKVLTSLEVDINSAASTLGMNGWKVRLSTETETKSGTVKLGVQIIVSSPKATAAWECWSGGEAQRLRLAIALGLSYCIQRALGSWWDLEILDEPSTYLSPEGVENLLETLDYRADAAKKQIWIVDHVAMTYSNFKEVWCIEKDPEKGSKLRLEARREV